MTCFVTGTKIKTNKGDVAVESLQPGDLVLTRDNGFQPVHRMCSADLSGRQQLDNPHLRPVMVQVGAFGEGLPKRDTMMSPNLRLTVIEPGRSVLARDNEEFVPLKHLVDNKGVQQVDTTGVTYHHIGFSNHQVVAANGLWAESFQPSDRSLGVIGNAQRLEALEIFPELAQHCRPRKEITTLRRVNRMKFASGF